MKATITNNSKAPQGVHTADGLKFIEPGKQRTLDVLDAYLPRVQALPFLDVEVKGEADGTLAGPIVGAGEGEPLPPVTEFDPSMIPAMTDDELRAHIEHRDGKAPHHKVGRAKLEALARGDAD